MFKGIRNFKLLMLGSIFLVSTQAFAERDYVSESLRRCSNSGGTKIQEPEGGRVSEVSNSGGVKVEKICYDILCYKSTGNIGNVNFQSIAEFRAQNTEQRGAAEIAFDTNVCKTRTSRTTVTETEIGGLDGDGDASGSGSGSVTVGVGTGGGGAFKVKYEGAIYACRAGEDYLDCLRRHGVKVTGSVHGTLIGTDGNGLKIIKVVRGGSIDVDADVTGSTRVQIPSICYKKKCNWAWLCLKDKIVLRDECKGIGIGTTIGVDQSIGRDIDGHGDITIRGNGGGDNGYFYVNYNGRRFRCAASSTAEACLRNRYGIIVSGLYDSENCVNCGSRWSDRRASYGNSWAGVLGGVAQIAGAILPPVMMYKGMKVQANAYLGANQAWANAMATGYEQCQIMQTNYINSTYSYISDNELADRTVNPPQCNGYNLGQFAGTQGWGNNGWGGWGNGWNSSGYSPQFLAAMNGGFNGNSLFNTSGMYMNPNAGFNMNGNINLNSLLGLPPNGINFNGGWGGNFNTGFPNGGWNGNFNGGWNTGFPNGGFNGGWNTGFPNGGWNGNFNTGWNTGFPNGGWNGNFNSGWNGNFNGGWNGNANFNPMWGNTSNGLANWNNNSVNGNQWWSAQNNVYQNQQAAAQGSYFQQQALSNQANRANYNMNYGYAPFAPNNVGLSFNYGFGFQ